MGQNTKLRVHPWRLIWRFLIVLLVIYVVAFGVFFTTFFNVDWVNWHVEPAVWDFRQPLIIAGIFVVGVAMFIPALTSSYYIVDKHSFIVKKYGRETEFEYSNIEFIDIEMSEKKKMVIFYSKTARMRYLLGDKDGILLETLIKKCPETMSREEFRRRHPEEKY